MKCNYCGADNKEGSKFCASCGAELKEKKKAPKKEEVKVEKVEVKEVKPEVKPEPVKVEEKTGDGKGTASLVLGIVSLIVWCVTPITSLIGLILGICAKKSGKKTAGIILNSIALGFAVIGLIVLFGFGYFAALVGETPDTPVTPITPVTPAKPVTPSKPTTIAGKTLTFDKYELTFGNNYSIIKDENTSSSHYGDEVIKLPVTIKNNSDSRDHLNMYYHDYYGPDGEKLDKLNYDFTSKDEAIDYVYLDPYESKVQYFYILYNGNGKYKIQFHNYKEEKSIEFTIKK